MARKNYVAIPPKSLKTDVLSTDSTFKIRDILWYTGSDGVAVNLAASDFGSDNVGYGVFEPKTAREEWFTFSSANMATAVTGGLTITLRGLIRTAPYTTEATARKHNHESGSIVLLYTNSPAFYDDFANKDNDETITGLWQFPTGSNYPVVGASYSAPTSDTHVATKKYADDLAIAGAPDGSTTVKGIFEEATVAEQGSATATGATGARLIPANANLVKTSSGASDENKIAVLDSTGTFADGFIDKARTWGTVQSFTADNCQITTDANSSNDAVRKSYADSLASLDYGDGSDVDVTISVPTTLTRDMFYNDLTLNADVNAASFRIYVKGTLTRATGVKITNNGGAGGNGTAGTNPSAGAAGAAGTAVAAGSMLGGVAGLIGAAGNRSTSGVNNPGVAGTSGSAQSPVVVNAAGAAGGAGGGISGTGTSAAGAAGAGGSITRTTSLPFSYVRAQNLFEFGGGTFVALKVTGQSGSGGSGATLANGAGMIASSGGSGGSGASGGRIFLAARSIIVNGTGTFLEAKGGNGGNGGASHVTDAGGGGQGVACGSAGGAGGNGGEIYLKTQSITGTLITDVTGGTAGTSSTGTLVNGGGSSYALNPLPTTASAGSAGLVITLD